MNKGQFPKSNKTISGIDLPKIDQDDDAGHVDGELIWLDINIKYRQKDKKTKR